MTMTNDRMALIELIEKGTDADLVRQMLAFAAERLTEAEVEARTGVPHGERDPDRLVQRNGFRERAWDTRAGRIDLEIPGCARAATSPVSWSHAGPPKGADRSDTRGLCPWRLHPGGR